MIHWIDDHNNINKATIQRHIRQTQGTSSC